MWKGFVGQVVMSLQRTYVEPQEREDPDNPSSSYSQLVRLGCFGIALGAAVVFTLPAVMTAFLPPSSKHVVTSPPSAFLGSYISHLSGHLAGATPLPFAFAWYLAFDGLLLLAISGRTPEAAEDSSRTEPGQVVLLMGLKVALLAVLTLVVGGIKLGLFGLFRVLDAKASRLKDKRLHKIVKRGRQLALVACNFILAWPGARDRPAPPNTPEKWLRASHPRARVLCARRIAAEPRAARQPPPPHESLRNPHSRAPPRPTPQPSTFWPCCGRIWAAAHATRASSRPSSRALSAGSLYC